MNDYKLDADFAEALNETTRKIGKDKPEGKRMSAPGNCNFIKYLSTSTGYSVEEIERNLIDEGYIRKDAVVDIIEEIKTELNFKPGNLTVLDLLLQKLEEQK